MAGASIKETARLLEQIDRSLSTVIVGQTQLRRRLLTAILCGGHVLLEGVPGLAKTLAVKSLAQTIHASFHRIQFTPDLLPADIIGTEIYLPAESRFEVRRGPVFAHIVLADEINRAPAKVQSALLETMQERQVTIGQQTFPLPAPFFVLATQNPIEQEGTYPLPEAQVDRFLLKVRVSYPQPEDELELLNRAASGDFSKARAEAVASIDDILRAQSVLSQIYVDPKVRRYITDLIHATRDPKAYNLQLESLIQLGASPRGTLSLFSAAQAEALQQGEEFVVPQHIKDVAHDVLRHRIMPSFEAEAEGMTTDDIIDQILRGVPVP